MNDGTIRVYELAEVLEIKMQIEKGESLALAEFVLDIFGSEDRVIDNVLEPSDRQLFYFLEGSGVLSTGRETISLYDGRDWRIHYWIFNRDKIINQLKIEEKEKEEKREENIYDTLPAEAWAR